MRLEALVPFFLALLPLALLTGCPEDPAKCDDCDNDGYVDAAQGGDDCDDGDAAIHPGAAETDCDGIDQDCDGTDRRPDADGDGYACEEDCDDVNPDRHAGAEEIACDGIDQDCNGDDLQPDDDDDGYVCEEDCDDADSATHAGADEIPCDGIDQDCDGEDDCTIVEDLDGDGWAAPEDCDDGDPDVHPDADEIPCDGVDQDCSDGDLLPDLDGDGHACDDDCDDTDPRRFVGASEVACDGVDQDCSGADLVPDLDGDGHACADDCDDTDPRRFVGASEIACDGIDQDCSGADLVPDLDGDGYACDDDCNDGDASIHIDADETSCDGIDQDCDGEDLRPDPDGDGHACDDDCDESDARRFLGNPEVACDGIDQDCDGLDLRPDLDGDGYACEDDCDDTNAAIHPGADEILCDGVDQDCDGRDATVDEDGDGADCLVDCDDADAAVHPDADDPPCDGEDTDCDGCDGICEDLFGVDDLDVGDLVLSEILQNSSGAEPANEWFEVYVEFPLPVDLGGLQVHDADGRENFTVEGSLVVCPETWVVFGYSALDFVDYAYAPASFRLSNATDTLRLLTPGGLLVDGVTYDDGVSFPDPTGASMTLDPYYLDATSNDDGTHWCTSTTDFGWMDRGTPGLENESCFGVDMDRDGHPLPADCDDTDPTIHPGATEIPDDGIDQDCDGADAHVTDDDGDGYPSTEDCDDHDAGVHPGADDPVCDDLDQDCDGCDGICGEAFEASDLVAGDLVLNEIMQNPSGSEPASEWFEVFVAFDVGPVDLAGLRVCDDDCSESSTLTASTLVCPGEYIVFGRTALPHVDVTYGSVVLNNSSDWLRLLAGDTLIDAVAYDDGRTFPDPTNASMNLDPTAMDATSNDVGTNWCAATLGWAAGSDLGSPGFENESCFGEDADGDGWPSSSDCDDTNAAIHPGATEIPCDDIDQDCDGADDCAVDADGDGYADDVDCDDGDASVHPDAPEILCDGVDQDCDGADACDEEPWDLSALGVGDLVLNEIMQNPSGSEPASEWFEVYVAFDLGPVDLNGLRICDDDCSESYTLASSTVVFPGEYVVFGRTALAHVDVTYGSVVLNNTSDWLRLLVGDTVIDAVAYDDGASFPDPADASMNLDPSAMDAVSNDLGANWCASRLAWGAGTDLGTPGLANASCGAVDADGDGWPSTSDCDDTNATIHPGAPEIPCDDFDQDCDGADACGGGDDADGDGWTVPDDCDDGDASVHPGAPDAECDGLDADCDDCDGVCADAYTAGMLIEGDLVISEVIQNSNGTEPDYEWFEVYVNVTGLVDLQGISVHDDDSSELFTVSTPLYVCGGDYVVFANSPVSGVGDYHYDASSREFILNNSVDWIIIDYAGDLLDQIQYQDGAASWPRDSAGHCMNLDPDALSASLNDDGANWCNNSTSAWPGVDPYCTPGLPNIECP